MRFGWRKIVSFSYLNMLIFTEPKYVGDGWINKRIKIKNKKLSANPDCIVLHN